MVKQDRQVIEDYLWVALVVNGEDQGPAADRVGLSQSRLSQINKAIKEGRPVAVGPGPYAKMLRYVIAHREAQFREGAKLVVGEVRAKLDELDARLTSDAEDAEVADEHRQKDLQEGGEEPTGDD